MKCCAGNVWERRRAAHTVADSIGTQRTAAAGTKCTVKCHIRWGRAALTAALWFDRVCYSAHSTSLVNAGS